MKLQSMTDFVLDQEKEFITPSKPFDKNEAFNKIINYANFLKTPLSLGMFVPVDLDGNVLEERIKPDWDEYHNEEGGNAELYQHNLREYKEYKNALDCLFFEGFELMPNAAFKNTIYIKESNTRLNLGHRPVSIERLVALGYDLTLTKSAINLIQK